MALTRKFLTAHGIEDEKIDEIITAHSETVNALKGERDNYKADAEKLPTVEKELNDLKKLHENDEENPFESKYNTLKSEFEDYKNKVKADEAKRAKSAAYEALLKEVGISEKRLKSILKVTNLDEIELDKDGKVKDADNKKEAIKAEWADFIVKNGQIGADTDNPPENNGGDVKTKDEIMKIKDTSERQAEWAKLIKSEREND